MLTCDAAGELMAEHGLNVTQINFRVFKKKMFKPLVQHSYFHLACTPLS
jgi:hypothetical protein